MTVNYGAMKFQEGKFVFQTIFDTRNLQNNKTSNILIADN